MRDSKKFRPKLRTIFFGAVFLALAYLGVNFAAVYASAETEFDGTADAAIILGAAQYNGAPSPVLRARLQKGGDLWLDGKVGTVVVTGGGQSGDITTEGKAGYDYLSAGRWTIPEEQLLIENTGRSTYESISAAAAILQRRGAESVIVVTDPYHAKRSELVAESFGLKADAVVTDSEATKTKLLRETLAVSVGRIIGFRRLEQLSE